MNSNWFLLVDNLIVVSTFSSWITLIDDQSWVVFKSRESVIDDRRDSMESDFKLSAADSVPSNPQSVEMVPKHQTWTRAKLTKLAHITAQPCREHESLVHE